MSEGRIDYGEWKPVPGIDASKLLVSSRGWVRTRCKGGKNPLGNPWKGSAVGTGALRVGVDGKPHLVHRLVATVFIGPPPSPLHTVDHLNQDSSDNRASNLRWATHHEQRMNQGTRKRSRLSKPVTLVSGAGVVSEYPSTLAAAAAIGANAGALSHAIHKKGRVNGYTASFNPEEDQGDLVADGEVERWALALDDPSVYVSTMGRIQRRRFSVWGFRMTPGPKKRFAGYCSVRVANKNLLMHRVVLTTFRGPPPTDGATYSADHINQKRHDNRLSNLRWATGTQQSLNTSHSKSSSA